MAITRTRFAPSPTGMLHLGHVYAAMFAHNLAAENNGECLLRFEDIDITRVRPEYYQAIVDDLSYLGLSFPKPYLKQTLRNKNYQQALEKLKQLNLVYPCFCSRKDIQHELAQIPNAPHGPEGTHYPGKCKRLTEDQIQQNYSNNIIPSWRFNSAQAAISYPSLNFTDALKGQINVDPSMLGDIILARKDIGTSYHIAVIIDDAHQNITDVTRGEDLIHATHIHRILQTALDLPEPLYHHHKLITDTSGKRFSKRDQSVTIKHLIDQNESAKSILARVLF